MDSINKQQAEDNYENLHGPEATKKMREIAEQVVGVLRPFRT
jgi:hypothetical protein